MERLTGKYLGRTGLVDNLNVQCPKICNQSFCESCPIQKAFDKLAHYEDLEEQNLLIKLPCKVGDTVYKLWYSNGIPYRIQELKIRTLENVVSIVKHNLLGERVFLTKEEAERKLKELEND